MSSKRQRVEALPPPHNTGNSVKETKEDAGGEEHKEADGHRLPEAVSVGRTGQHNPRIRYQHGIMISELIAVS